MACGVQNLSNVSLMVKYYNLIGFANIPAAATETWRNPRLEDFKKVKGLQFAFKYRQTK